MFWKPDTSIDVEEFAKELAGWFYENGLCDATQDNCVSLCISIHALALDFAFNSNMSADDDKIVDMKAIIFLDSLTTILAELNIINPHINSIALEKR